MSMKERIFLELERAKSRKRILSLALAVAMDDDEEDWMCFNGMKRQRTHAFWMSPFLRARTDKTQRNTFAKLEMDFLRLGCVSAFRNSTRMPPTVYKELLDLVSPLITYADTNWRLSIKPEERLSLTIRYLTRGDSVTSLYQGYLVGESTVLPLIRDTCRAIYTALAPEYMKESWEEEKEDDEGDEEENRPGDRSGSDDDSDDDPWYEGAAYLVYRAQCCEEYTRNRAAKVWLRLLCRMWRCLARTLCLRPMKLMCPNNRKTAELEQYLTAFLLLLIGLLVIYLMFGGHKPDMEMPYLELGAADKDTRQLREAQLEREKQMMSDLEHGQVVKAHMDVPGKPGEMPIAHEAKRNPEDDIFDPLKTGKLPRILGGGKKELDYGNDDTDLHGFVGPERVYFYNHEEEPLAKADVQKARKEIKILRHIEDADKNEDSLKPDAVDEPGFHGFVGPDTVIEYEHDDKFVAKRRKQQRMQKAKEELYKVNKQRDYNNQVGDAKAGRLGQKTRRRRSLPPPSRSLQSEIIVMDKEDLVPGADTKCSGCKVYNMSSAIQEEFECIHLSVKPNTPICLHDNAVDVHISATLRRDAIWEPHIVKEMQNILLLNPDMHLIDIGANIGVYTLVAANLGRQVLAVEPYLGNIWRLQKAANMAGIANRITLLQNAVSDSPGTMYLQMNKNNQGGIALKSSGSKPCRRGADCGPEVNTVTMDDLRHHANFSKSVLKIDIEGHEHRAFQHVSKLLDTVYIPYIIMEWQKLRSYFGSEITDTEDKTLVWKLVRFLKARGYSASSLLTGSSQDIAYWYGWPDDVIWKHELQDLM